MTGFPTIVKCFLFAMYFPTQSLSTKSIPSPRIAHFWALQHIIFLGGEQTLQMMPAPPPPLYKTADFGFAQDCVAWILMRGEFFWQDSMEHCSQKSDALFLLVLLGITTFMLEKQKTNLRIRQHARQHWHVVQDSIARV